MMSIIIQKYGGTSVGSIERIRNVAELVMAEKQRGHHVIVVASAMAGVTNTLVQQAGAFVDRSESIARDFVISNGENISCGLLALALQSQGVSALPLAGWQIPMITTSRHGNADILDIDTQVLHRMLSQGVIPVITGFQGISENGHITTLGRGGSDTSAVAIAAAVKAERCDIYTDIDGIYTADPRLVSESKLIPKMSYAFALHMAQQGAKVIHPRAVEWARNTSVDLRILSSFGSDKLTEITAESVLGLCAVAHLEESWVSMAAVPIEIVTGISDHFHEEEIELIQWGHEVLLWANHWNTRNSLDDFLRDRGVGLEWRKVSKLTFVFELAEAMNLRSQTIEELLKDASIPALYRWVNPGRLSMLILPETLKLCANYIHRWVV